MNDEKSANEGTSSFGITNETQSKNPIPFKISSIHPYSKAILTSVIKEMVGKVGEKWLVLTFVFRDIEDPEAVRTFRHSEFIIKPNVDKDKEAKNKNRLNVRIKHIHEAFMPVGEAGIGVGATSWEDFFDKIATTFNTGNNGKPIYQRIVEEKTVPIPVWLKVVYDNRNNPSFPMLPNFIEKITANNQKEPSTLSIDKRYDKLEQVDEKSSTGIMGNAGNTGAIQGSDNYGFPE